MSDTMAVFTAAAIGMWGGIIVGFVFGKASGWRQGYNFAERMFQRGPR